MDHITSTKNFTLQHLRFLVIDEADRLLNQSYHDWLNKVLQAATAVTQPSASVQMDEFGSVISFPWSSFRETRRLISFCFLLLVPLQYPAPQLRYYAVRKCQAGVYKLTGHSGTASFSFPWTPGHVSQHPLSDLLQLQKLLFSATLTRNPSKIASLRLVSPRYFAVKGGGLYVTPSTLHEYMVVCDAGEKPLVVLHFLLTKGFRSTLCFTSSVESTHRLFRLLQMYGGFSVSEFSSSLPQLERTKILQDFRDGGIQLLICSDGMARGLDIEHVENVISYDPPAFVKTYVHRVGRTARAGREGTSYTIVSPKEVHHFKDLMLKTSKKRAERFILPGTELAPLVPKYQEALASLKKKLHEEKSGKVLVENGEDDGEQEEDEEEDNEGEDTRKEEVEPEFDAKRSKMMRTLRSQMQRAFE